ncbi:Golgi CORVET complex core vacuolar protein 8-domain-containing protein [Infundibulicybe gibba]|nr:Golgi CORVET complex core vacuolar protein 8-domain-containing protein [Infundibulicybe gibba]
MSSPSITSPTSDHAWSESLLSSSGTLPDPGDDQHDGDYSTRMEELLNDDEDGPNEGSEGNEDDEEGFLYNGVDATDSSFSGYHDLMSDVLEEPIAHEAEEPLALPGPTPEILQVENSGTFARAASPALNINSARPFLHPTVSRLRSHTPQSSPVSSNSWTRTSFTPESTSHTPSNESSLSRISSLSNLQIYPLGLVESAAAKPPTHSGVLAREVFRWTELQDITRHAYSSKIPKASSVLGSLSLGSPTVLAANGFICIGMDSGKICVYDFKQNLKCICGDGNGPVTALALSHDHTYVASGHSSGHLQLFDLKVPQHPVRFVPPTTLVAVSSGRKEGHLLGSKIVSIAFVAERHTAIVSADEHGLAFYHSLGKVLFVEAADTLRILGKYPLDGSTVIPASLSTSRIYHPSMAPLPMGSSSHVTDKYNIIALLTPTKIVVVGLKPTPKTWFKCVRQANEGGPWKSKTRWKGNLAWFPSVLHPQGKINQPKIGSIIDASLESTSTTPCLVYTWGSVMHFIRVSESRSVQSVRNPRSGKTQEVEIGRISYEDAGLWTAEEDIFMVQWLNVNQVVVLLPSTLAVYDIRSSSLVEHVQFDSTSLMSPSLGATVNGAIPYAEAVTEVAHSLRIYKGKIFLLGRDNIRVGTLLTWADRILSLVEAGDFLSAIELTRLYYLNEAPGNQNGLPDDSISRQLVIGEKMRDLMIASASYAFSDDRMTDGTHFTPDGRGVDRTSLFQGLVKISCLACMALEDFEFLFEDLYQRFEEAGISRIYTSQLEPFILTGQIRLIPPRITQRLVALHDEDGAPQYVERLIWHIDPACLDINQAIHLCQRHHLYDALIYVYTRALRDYVAPIVDLINLIREVQREQLSSFDFTDAAEKEATLGPRLETVILDAYKLYPYLANILSGLTYPSEEPLPDDEALIAKKDVYSFIFSGRSTTWPSGEEAKLILTSDEVGGVEPTYPYARLLLNFDAESFLHSLDLAFEDSFLNDELQGISRLVIVRILLEIITSETTPPRDVSFVNIFVARNVPKYPQFLQIAPSTLHKTLLGLATDGDRTTREDRQLAAEYLLSVYNPHESDHITHLFRDAGFYRILRSWHRQEQQWPELLKTLLDDPDLHYTDLFHSIDEVLLVSARANKGSPPPDLVDTLQNALPRLLQSDVTRTASVLDKHTPHLHRVALTALGDDGDHERFLYLEHIISPSRTGEHFPSSSSDEDLPSRLGVGLCEQYISLACRFRPSIATKIIKSLSSNPLDWKLVLQACESTAVYDAAIWILNWKDDAEAALVKSEAYQKHVVLELAQAMNKQSNTPPDDHTDIRHKLDALKSIGRASVETLEDAWLKLLRSQIQSVQNVSDCFPDPETRDDATLVISTMRSLIQETFGSLVSTTSAHPISFPRLFKRLINSGPTAAGTHYTEFRTILTQMLESYRSDGDMLVITKRMLDRDIFEKVAQITRDRGRGWAPSQNTCASCRESLLQSTLTNTPNLTSNHIIISRTGSIRHSSCSSRS